MNKKYLIIGIICFIIALMIIIFGSGLRVVYSSALFILFGIILTLNAVIRSKNKKE